MSRSRGAAFVRQWSLLRHLGTSSSPRRIGDIASSIGASRRTVYRDLGFLQDAGFPIASESRAGTSFWSILPAAIPAGPLVAGHEVLALDLAAQHLDYARGSGLPEALRSLRALLSSGERVRRPAEATGPRGPRPSARRYARHVRYVALVRDAIARRRVLSCRYRAASSASESQRRLRPYALWLSGSAAYVAAHCESRRDVRLFALDRFTSIRTTDDAFDRPAFDLHEYMGPALGAMRGGPARDVAIRLEGWAAEMAAERRWHASQRVEELPGRRAVLHLRVSLTEELVGFVLRFGGLAVPLEPPELRAWVIATLERALEAVRAAEPAADGQLLLFPEGGQAAGSQGKRRRRAR